MILKSYRIKSDYVRIRDNKEISYSRLKLVHDIQCDNCPIIFTKILERKQRTNSVKHLCSQCYSFGHTARLLGHQSKIDKSKNKIGERRIGKGKYPEIYLGYDTWHTTFQGYWAREHVYVMEEKLGYKIPTGYVVHHIDGNKQNNIEDNLVLLTVEEHNNAHAKSESLVFQLVVDGLVVFDSETKLYRFSNK